MRKDHQTNRPGSDWRAYAERVVAEPPHRPSFGQLMQQSNRVAWEKTHKAAVGTFPAEEEEWDMPEDHSRFSDLPLKVRILRQLIALILLPLVFVSVMSLFDQLSQVSGSLDLLLSVPVWYAIMGALIWIILGCSRLFTSSLLYLYVLGHELTHALAVYCSCGYVSRFKASLDGGYIQTNKSNIFISLSPYFLPLWGLVWGIIWGCLYLFCWHTVTCEALLYGGLGFWWCFHLFWTAWMIPKDQPDLASNGTFFSLILVYFANLLLFLVLLRLFNAVSLSQFANDCLVNAENLWDTAKDLGRFIVGFFSSL